MSPDDLLEAAISALVGDDEIVTHFDLLVECRTGPDAKRFRYRRFTSRGSSPALSLGVLDIIRGRLEHRLCDGPPADL